MYLTSIMKSHRSVCYNGGRSRSTPKGRQHIILQNYPKKLNEFKVKFCHKDKRPICLKWSPKFHIVESTNSNPHEGLAMTSMLQYFIILNLLQDLTAMILELKEENMVRKILTFH